MDISELTYIEKNNDSDSLFTDLSNDSYSTVNLGLDEGASPHSIRGSYMHGSSSPSQYPPSSRSPPPVGQGHTFGSYPDNIVYTNIGELLRLGKVKE